MAAITSMITAIFMYAQHLEIILLDILEILVSIYLEFTDCELVSYDDSVWVYLKSRKGAFV